MSLVRERASFLDSPRGIALLEIVAVALLAYLLGSIPTAYVVGRLARGVDIREYGSGNVGAANALQAVSGWALVVVGIVDLGKGLAAVAITRGFDLPLGAQIAGGLLAIAGHNWPLFLGFNGGRGMATTLGVLLLLAPRELGVGVAISLAGVALRNVPLLMGAGVLSLPLSALLLGEPVPLVLGLVGVLVLMVIRRLTAGRRGGVPSPMSRRVLLLNRLLFDRDVRQREIWIHGRRRSDEPPTRGVALSATRRRRGEKEEG